MAFGMKGRFNPNGLKLFNGFFFQVNALIG